MKLVNATTRRSEGVLGIRDRKFRRRRVKGPAVLYFLGDGCVMNDVVFSGHPDAILCEYEGAKVPIGAIVLERVTFERCSFTDVSIIARPSDIARFKMAFQTEQFEQEVPRGGFLDGLRVPGEVRG